MTVVIDKLNEINGTIKEIFDFIQKDNEIQADFNEYLSTIGAVNIKPNQMEKVFLPYIFERKINNKSILKRFAETKKESSKLADSLMEAQTSVFGIKKILKNGFELYNLINEQTYEVLSLTKMTNFRGVYAGQFIIARIFEYDGDYYVVEISNVLAPSQKDEVMRYAVMKLVQSPRLLYKDNKAKEKEIKKTVDEMYKKFIEAFNTDIILTTNKHADEIIGAFNDGEDIDISEMGSNLEQPKFFHVRELDNNYSNFLENSLGGFASHAEEYDVAVIFDKESGLYAVPFFETFTKIFENKESVEGADDCIRYFMENDSIPPEIIERAAAQHPNFINVVNESLGTAYTLKDLIKEYKSDFLKNKIYSSATILYCSRAFSEVFDAISNPKEQPAQITQKVGRNEPCPCGSGKKFKNCCGKEI